MRHSRRNFLQIVSAAIPAAPIVASAGRLLLAKDGVRQAAERLVFQTSRPWSPRINLNADAVLVYGIGQTLPSRIESWRAHGYHIEVMTGIAWGRYQNYLDGQFDGKTHDDEAQTDQFGNQIRHGSRPGQTIYYMVPTESYIRFVTAGLEKALDAGAKAICLEEPEFWVRGGYSEAFKREWRAYYGEGWIAPDSSPDAQYRASKLKYYLYRRALTQAFDFVHKHSEAKRKRTACYVATHSLLNYSQWRIVSPESSLEQVNCDGYIAQVWTGTARTPNVYQRRKKERTFETAFLEYGALLNFSRVSGRSIWLLNDPVEDNPNHSWKDYRNNWESTMTASLLHPDAWRYEIMPWPERVFNGKYPVQSIAERKPGQPVERAPIPQEYATELQVVTHALREMKQPKQAVQWEQCGAQGVGILVSDTMMFERGDTHPSDPNLGSFYGLALPLLMRGLPVEPVQMEYASKDGFLDASRVLLLTYEGQKPPSASFHKALAKWVRAGGALVVIDDDHDPYNSVREWWNSAPFKYPTPRYHLFEILGLNAKAAGVHAAGRGAIVWEPLSPAALSYQPDGAHQVIRLVLSAAKSIHFAWKESRTLVLRRGSYIIGAGLEEPDSDAAAPPLRGRFIDLFDSGLSILEEVVLTPGQKKFLLDVGKYQKPLPRVLAAACRITEETAGHNMLRFRAEGIEGTEAVARVALPGAPGQVLVNGKQLPQSDIDQAESPFKIRFANSAAGNAIEINY